VATPSTSVFAGSMSESWISASLRTFFFPNYYIAFSSLMLIECNASLLKLIVLLCL